MDFDGNFLTLLELTLVGTDAEESDFFGFTINNDPGPLDSFFTVGVVFDFEGQINIPASDQSSILIATYEVNAAAPIGEIIVMEPQGGLGTPQVPLGFVLEGVGEIRPLVVAGTLTIVGGTLFIRGDSDFNGVFDGLLDSLFTLGWGFSGGPTPPCMDAVDADDNGIVNPLQDALYSLSFAFSGGPAVPPPFPAPGLDPTDDMVGCEP